MDISQLYESFTPDSGRAARHRKIDEDHKNAPQEEETTLKTDSEVRSLDLREEEESEESTSSISGSLVVAEEEEGEEEEYDDTDIEMDLMAATALLERCHTLLTRLYAEHLLNNFNSYNAGLANTIKGLRDEVETFSDSMLKV